MPWVRHVAAVGTSATNDRMLDFETLVGGALPELAAEPTSRDAPAFWLYSSGSTGRPRGCVHLQHDMLVCAEAYARGVLGIEPSNRCFSVAKLFLAYGLGNAMYFPMAVGATVSCGRAPSPRRSCMTSSSGIGRRCSSRSPRITRCCWRIAARPASSTSRASDAPCQQARRCHQPCWRASASDSPSTLSMASVRLRSCTSSFRTAAGASVLAPAGCSFPDMKRNSSTSTARWLLAERSAACSSGVIRYVRSTGIGTS
jgi:hypothetical protein